MSERDVSPGNLPFKLKPKLIVIAIIVIAVLSLVLSSFYIVDQTERAVVLRFGQFLQINGPGLHFKLPFGIDTSINVPIKVQDLYFGYRTDKAGITTIYSRRDYPEESIMLTGDLNIVDIEWTLQFKINDPKAWLFAVENQEKTIRDISQSTINLLVGDRSIFDVIGSERDNIQIRCRDMMNEILREYNLGIDVIEVKLQNTRPPEGRVFDSFEDVNVAIQDMNRLINEGKEEYNKIIPKASGEAERLIQEAKGYASERVNEADGDVARFNAVLTEYLKAKDITRARLYIEMIEEVFANQEGTTLIDKNLENFIPFQALQSEGGVR